MLITVAEDWQPLPLQIAGTAAAESVSIASENRGGAFCKLMTAVVPCPHQWSPLVTEGEGCSVLQCCLIVVPTSTGAALLPTSSKCPESGCNTLCLLGLQTAWLEIEAGQVRV